MAMLVGNSERVYSFNTNIRGIRGHKRQIQIVYVSYALWVPQSKVYMQNISIMGEPGFLSHGHYLAQVHLKFLKSQILMQKHSNNDSDLLVHKSTDTTCMND